MNIAISASKTNFSLSDSKYYLILFILWPFLAFISAIINYQQREARRVVYLFLIYYGLTMLAIPGLDSFTYALRLQQYAIRPFSEFFEMVGGLYTDDTSVDIVQPLITFVVSRFTLYPGVLFALFAALFGFFYLKSINLLYERLRKNPGFNGQIHLFFLLSILPITAVNGFRMWTAAWIFFYGAYHVILFKDKRYLIVALASILVHFSFILANVVLLGYFIFGNRNIIYIPLMIASFILPQLLEPLINSLAGNLGGALEARYESYSNEYYIQTVQDRSGNAAWFMVLYNDLAFYYLSIVIIIINIKFQHLMNGKGERNLFSFLLVFLTFVNFGGVIPSVGGRFQTIFFLFAALYVFLFFVKLPRDKINFLTWVGFLPIFLMAAVRFRQGADTINAWIFAPGFGLPLFAPGISLTELIF